MRICTDTHQKNDHREESTSLFDGDRGDPAFDTDSMLTSPEPGVDYLTVGKVYSHRVDKFPNDPEDTQRWLTHPRKSSA